MVDTTAANFTLQIISKLHELQNNIWYNIHAFLRPSDLGPYKICRHHGIQT